jgi:hypoxanthine phosphoribosyltransferase
MEKNKLYLSWKWVDDQINKIGDKLEGLNLEFVAGIPRGGLIPAVMMSHAFGIKYISYSSAKMLPGDLRKKTLVVDDISDTGVTIA